MIRTVDFTNNSNESVNLGFNDMSNVLYRNEIQIPAKLIEQKVDGLKCTWCKDHRMGIGFGKFFHRKFRWHADDFQYSIKCFGFLIFIQSFL